MFLHACVLSLLNFVPGNISWLPLKVVSAFQWPDFSNEKFNHSSSVSQSWPGSNAGACKFPMLDMKFHFLPDPPGSHPLHHWKSGTLWKAQVENFLLEVSLFLSESFQLWATFSYGASELRRVQSKKSENLGTWFLPFFRAKLELLAILKIRKNTPKIGVRPKKRSQ